MNFDTLHNTEAGIMADLFRVPNKTFVPRNLCQVVCYSDHVYLIGANIKKVVGSSIGFDYQSTRMAAVGEYFERISASYYRKILITDSYENIAAKGDINVLDPDKMKLYADWQYEQPGFPFPRLTPSDEIAWVEGFDLICKKKILVPASMGYYGYNRNNEIDKGKSFFLNTTTGLASGPTFEEAVKGGFLECAERHAFTNFWYNQRKLVDTIPMYNQDTIVKNYPDNKQLMQLFKNPRVKIVIFDLSELVPVDTVLAITFFKYKNKSLLSLGAASRFNKEDAIIKATLETYQGVEYATNLISEHKDFKVNFKDFREVDSFEKHFLFYSVFPEFREEVPILKAALHNESDEIKSDAKENKMQDIHDIHLTGLEHLIYVDNSINEIKELGFHVARVLTPGWSYLTPEHIIPFLGTDVMKDRDGLFLEFPHPFP